MSHPCNTQSSTLHRPCPIFAAANATAFLFAQAFYDAYFDEMPKQPGFDKRRDLYLVYHYLNHYNLFGGGYIGESERLLRKLGKAVGA